MYFQTVLETARDVIVLADGLGRITFWNPVAESVFGYSESEVIGQPLTMLMPGRFRDAHRAGLARYLLTGESPLIGRTVELTGLRKDGTEFPLELSLATGESGGQRFFTGVIRDITKRKRAEDALRLINDASALLQRSLEYEPTLRSLAELLVPRLADLCVLDLIEPDCIDRVIASHRPNSHVIQVIRERHRIDDQPTASAVGRMLDRGEPELVPVVDEAWLQAAARDDGHLAYVRTLAPTSILIMPLIARDTTLGALSLAMLDRSRRFSEADVPIASGVAARAALAISGARLYAAAVAATRVRDDVLATVSHDLRGPLASISANAELLALDEDSPRLAGIRKGVARANRLIEDLLAAAKIESGKLLLDCRPESIASIIDEVVDLHRPLGQAKALTMSLAVDPDIPLAVLDRHRVVQAISNVLGNAMKFTPECGRIEVRARRVGETVAIAISDTGPGLAADELSHLFERFWQGPHARRADAGLGLAITKGVVDAHGGEIQVQSEVGKGLTFTLSFCLAGPGRTKPKPPVLIGS